MVKDEPSQSHELNIQQQLTLAGLSYQLVSARTCHTTKVVIPSQ